MYPNNTQPAHAQPIPAQVSGVAPTPTPAPAARRSRTPLIAGLLAVALLLVGGGATVAVLRANNVGPFKDPGLAMCQAIGNDKSKAAGKGATMTEADYRKLRKPFADSRYSDIRDAGTKFVDLVWQFAGTSGKSNSDGALGMALLMGGQLVQTYSSLSGACANHGVTIPPLSQN